MPFVGDLKPYEHYDKQEVEEQDQNPYNDGLKDKGKLAAEGEVAAEVAIKDHTFDLCDQSITHHPTLRGCNANAIEKDEQETLKPVEVQYLEEEQLAYYHAIHGQQIG